jgi:hypothetical protein
MPEKRFPNALDDVLKAGDWLAREVEQLEVTGKRITAVRYPKLLGRELRVAELGAVSRYGKYEAIGHRGEYQIVIEYDD